MKAQLQKKVETVEKLKNKLSEAQSSILADYRGLNVAEATELRSKLREAGIEFKVVKNTLTFRAAKEIGLEDLEQYLEGPTAIAFSVEDPVAPAKILNSFAKQHNALEIKAGVLEGKVISFEKVKELANLPSREELLAKTLAGMQGPMYGFVNVLQGTIRSFVYALDALRQKKESEA